MVTKTLTITENAYDLLRGHKLERESFSEEITRLFSAKPKKSLKDFFGILSEEEGERMIKTIEKMRAKDKELQKKRVHDLYGI